MKRLINGMDILIAIGEIDEKLLAYPAKPRTRATIFKKLAVACVTVAICVTLVFAAIDQGIIGPPMLDKNDGAQGGDGNSMMGGSDNENSAPSSPHPPENDNDVSNSIHGALRIEKDGSFENYVQNGNCYNVCNMFYNPFKLQFDVGDKQNEEERLGGDENYICNNQYCTSSLDTSNFFDNY
jgi:hypothetical protein